MIPPGLKVTGCTPTGWPSENVTMVTWAWRRSLLPSAKAYTAPPVEPVVSFVVVRPGRVAVRSDRTTSGPTCRCKCPANTRSTQPDCANFRPDAAPVSYTHLRAHETDSYL